jgi:hypothetical protein
MTQIRERWKAATEKRLFALSKIPFIFAHFLSLRSCEKELLPSKLLYYVLQNTKFLQSQPEKVTGVDLVKVTSY